MSGDFNETQVSFIMRVLCVSTWAPYLVRIVSDTTVHDSAYHSTSTG